MNKIYVFTATGNSLAIAKEIGSKLDGPLEIASMGTLMQSEKWIIAGDKVGFVFPCYYGTVPQIVQRFITGAQSIRGNYFFGFVSAGGGTGLSLKHLDQALKLRGKKLHYGRSFLIAGNYMNGWYYSLMQPEQEQIVKNRKKTNLICEEAAEDIKGSICHREKQKLSRYILPRIISPNRYLKDTRPWDREFSVGEQCNSCQTCVKVCPVQNIQWKSEKPAFSHACQRCMACIQLCPRQAFFIKGKSMNKTPYRHERISVKELIEFHKKGTVSIV